MSDEPTPRAAPKPNQKQDDSIAKKGLHAPPSEKD